MAVVTTYSHQFMLEVLRKEHDLEDDTLKITLMDASFTFDPDTHATWSACSSNEVANGNGYTTGGETITNVVASINTTSDQVEIDSDNSTWTASGGSIGTTGSAIVYNDTHTNDTVVMCIDFGADYATADGNLFQINFSSGFGIVDNA